MSVDAKKRALETMRKGRPAGLSERDLLTMVGKAVKRFKDAVEAGLPYADEDEAGMYKAKEVPSYREFLRHCSEVNLIQLELLRLRNARLHEVYTCVFSGRNASESVNGLIGHELRQLNRLSAKVYLEDEEGDRLVEMSKDDPRKFYGDYCDSYLKRGDCHKRCCERIHVRTR